MDAFFFPSSSGARLFGVWRGVSGARRTWIFCPPFAEEEKSARRVFTEIAQRFSARGENSLIFSYRGTGDSEGDFADFGLADWRADILSAIAEAQNRAGATEIALLGLRLGASLAVGARDGAARLVLLEPILSGRSFLSQQNARKKLRAQLSGDQNLPAHDLDGWQLGEKLRDELETLDLRGFGAVSRFAGTSHVLQIGPKSEVAPPLAAFGEAIGAHTHSVVMPAFWNLLDYQKPTPLLEKLEELDD